MERTERATVNRRGMRHQVRVPAGVLWKWESHMVLWDNLTADELQDIVYHASNAITIQKIREEVEDRATLF